MTNRILFTTTLAVTSLLVACDDGDLLGPVGDGTGTIVLQFVASTQTALTQSSPLEVDWSSGTDAQTAAVQADGGDLMTTAAAVDEERSEVGDSVANGNDLDLRTLNGRLRTRSVSGEAAGTIEEARAILSGAKDTVVQLTVTTDSITGSISGLPEGTYSVVVEGLIGGDVDHFGQATGVTVTAGGTTPVTMVFGSFRPDPTQFALATSAALSFTIDFPAVAGANGYQVQWDTDTAFSAPDSASAGTPRLTVTVASSGTYYVRVRATNTSAARIGRWTDAFTFTAPINVDFAAIGMVLFDAYATVLIGGTDATTMAALTTAFAQCQTGVTENKPLLIDDCLTQARGVPGSGSGTDTALLAVLALYYTSAEQLLGFGS